MIVAEDLTKIYTPARSEPVRAVDGVSFAVQPGEVFGLLGPNGAGKTTLLRMLGAIIAPTSGRCWIGDAEPVGSPERIRRQMGFLSGNTKLYGRLTGIETLRYFGRLHRMEARHLERRIEELVDMLDMRAFCNRRCDSLSTGQLQRVSIARVLLHEPPALILDEPTLGLDIMSSSAILDFIADAKKQGRAVIFSTHYMTEAEYLCDRVALIHEGRFLSVGSQQALFAETDTSNLKDAFLRLVHSREQARP